MHSVSCVPGKLYIHIYIYIYIYVHILMVFMRFGKKNVTGDFHGEGIVYVEDIG